MSVDPEENELSILEVIHLIVETLTEYFDGVSELDMLFKLDRLIHFLPPSPSAQGEYDY
jgi:hypothetical protein